MIAVKKLIETGRRYIAPLSSLAVRVLGVGVGFALTILIGRWYGPEAYGEYAIITQTALFLSTVAIGGFEVAVMREFSRSVALGIPLSRHSMLQVTAQTMSVAMVLIAVLLVCGDDLLALIMHEEIVWATIAIVCVILLSRAFTRITSALLRSQGDYVLGQAVELLLIPLLTLAVIAAGFARTVDEILWATAGAGVLTALLGCMAALRHTSSKPEALRVPGRKVYALALPLWGEAIALSLTEWYGLAMVSALCGSHDAGLFRVAVQLASVISLVTMGLYGAFAPQISAAVHSGDMRKVAELAGSATRLSAIFILPGVAIFCVFAEPILHFIQPDFVAAASLLRVMVVGQGVFSVGAIWAGLVLALTGTPRINFSIAATGALIMLIGMPWFTQMGGILSAGLFTAALLIAKTIVGLIMVRRISDIDILLGRVLPAVKEREAA